MNYIKPSIILSLLLSVILLSCKEVRFTESQPRSLQEKMTFPDNYRGTYLDKNGDSLLITENRFSYRSGKEFIRFDERLSDSIFLKKNKEYYVLNMKEDSLWSVILLQRKSDSLLSWFVDGESQDKVARMKSVTKVDSVTDSQGNTKKYIVSPSAKEFNEMIEKKVFKPLIGYKKIK